MDNCYYEKIGNKIKNITEEIPFDIPDNWCWIRLNELGLFKKGPFGSSLTKEMFVPESTQGRIKVYEQKNAIQKDHLLGRYYISNQKFLEMKGFQVEPNDIIVSCAGTIGEIYVLPQNAEIGIINQALMRIKLYDYSILDYFLLYFDFVLKKEANEKGNGTGMKNIPPFDILKKMLIPLPPQNEMLKIINKINQLNLFVGKISDNQLRLKKLIDLTKVKILDYYFGENSCYKSYYENVCLESVCKITMGQSVEGNSMTNTNLKSAIEFHQGKIAFGDMFLNHSNQYTLSPKKIIDRNSIVICVRAPVGNVNISNRKIAIGRGLCGISSDKVELMYLYYYLLYMGPYYRSLSQGSTFASITIKTINKTPFMLCSSDLQQTIVASIQSSFDFIDKIKEQLI